MNTIKFLNSHSIQRSTFAADMANIRTSLYNIGVCWTDDIKGNFAPDCPFRVILFTRNNQVDFKNPLVKECNGLVLSFDKKWKLLAMPQKAFCTSKISMKKLNDLFVSGCYDTYEVLDATILTLYFYGGQWRVSSTKGYDIGSSEIITGTTYIDAIQHLMATKYKSFKFSNLSTNLSYTIAFRYSKYHIFDETKHLASRTKNIPKTGVDMNSYIMVLCVADLQNMVHTEKHVAGLPFQNPSTMNNASIHALTSYAKSSYAKYAKAYRLQNFKYKPLYGYILRAKHRSVPDEYTTIYIESELYKVIKTALYKDNDNIRSQDFNKLVINMSINHDKYEQFRIVFQQFESQFKQLEANLSEIATEVLSRIVEDNPMPPKYASELIITLVEKFKSEPNVTTGIIKDAIYSKSFSQYLGELLS